MPERAATSSTRIAAYPTRLSSSAVALTTRSTTFSARPCERALPVLRGGLGARATFAPYYSSRSGMRAGSRHVFVGSDVGFSAAGASLTVDVERDGHAVGGEID